MFELILVRRVRKANIAYKIEATLNVLSYCAGVAS